MTKTLEESIVAMRWQNLTQSIEYEAPEQMGLIYEMDWAELNSGHISMESFSLLRELIDRIDIEDEWTHEEIHRLLVAGGKGEREWIGQELLNF